MTTDHRPTTCYHGRRLDPGQGTLSEVEVIAHNAPAHHRAPLVHFVRHSPAGFEWGYGGSAPADLSRSLLIDALGPHAICPGCHGSGRVVWGEGSPGFSPYDPKRTPDLDPERISPCYCDGGLRALPYHDFKFEVVATWGDHWRITRADIFRWLVVHYGGAVGAPPDLITLGSDTPEWLLGAIFPAVLETLGQPEYDDEPEEVTATDEA